MRHFRTIWRCCLAALALSTPIATAQAQQVYVGVADQWNDLLTHPDDWAYVRAHADGFYVNFIEMDWFHSAERAMTREQLQTTASLFAHKNALYESDMHETSANEHLAVDALQAVGFTLPYTSLNYGWSAPRAKDLQTYHLLPGQKVRMNFVQAGPWGLGGSVLRDWPGPPFTNAEFRAWAAACDGISTDGPLGYWFTDHLGMRQASYSMVDFAHRHGKAACVMLCPYGAEEPSYQAKTMFLQVAKNCVHDHEDADAVPDIWSVFEYATDIPAVPEQQNGAPSISTTGVAYWLIHHVHDPEGWLQVGTDKIPGTHNVFHIKNVNAWVDFCPVLFGQVRTHGAGRNYRMRCLLDNTDITRALLSPAGFRCVRTFRIGPNSTHDLVIDCVGQGAQAPGDAAPEFVLNTAVYPAVTPKIREHTVLRLRAQRA